MRPILSERLLSGITESIGGVRNGRKADSSSQIALNSADLDQSHSETSPLEVPDKELADAIDLVVVASLRKGGEFHLKVSEP